MKFGENERDYVGVNPVPMLLSGSEQYDYIYNDKIYELVKV